MKYYLNESETKRFGHQIYRWNITKLSHVEDEFLELLKLSPDIIITNLDFKHLAEINQLINNYPAIIGGTKVLYEYDMENFDRNSESSVIGTANQCTAADWPELEQMIREMFDHIPTHYTFNPFLNEPKLILDSYIDWVKSNFDKGGINYFIRHENDNVGFFCAELKDTIAEGILAGVLPKYEGMSFYQEMYSYFMPMVGCDLGVTKIRTSTQVQNKAAIKHWQDIGWIYRSSSMTIHFNLFLGKLEEVNDRNLENAFCFRKTKSPSFIKKGDFASPLIFKKDHSSALSVDVTSDNHETTIRYYDHPYRK